MKLGRPIADRVIVVLSDVEMGAGGPTDDFPYSPFLAELIHSSAAPEFSDLRADLVFIGDTFDFLETPVIGKYPRPIGAPIALAKLERIRGAHDVFFHAVRDFPSSGERHVCFIAGNHDLELLFADRVKPRRQLFALMPEANQLPMKEVVYRFSSESSEVSTGEHYHCAPSISELRSIATGLLDDELERRSEGAPSRRCALAGGDEPMYWECTECGCRLEDHRRPRCCANCGTAGVIFVEATKEIEGDDFADSAISAWFERGMSWRSCRQIATC